MEEQVASRKVALFGLAAIALVGTLMAKSIFLSLPSNVLAIRDGGPIRKASVTFLPQGWAFFTKPPSDSDIVGFRLWRGGVESAMLTPQGDIANGLGLSRAQRAQGPEMAFLVAQVKDWVPCPAPAAAECAAQVAATSSYDGAENTSTVQSLCGRIVLVETTPVRWSYRHLVDRTRTALRAASLEARC